MRATRRSILVFTVLLLSATASADGGVQPTLRPLFDGVRFLEQRQTDPDPLVFYVVEVALANPHIRFTTTAGNGEGPGETWTETTRDFVVRRAAQVGINANFFSQEHEDHTDLRGIAASDGAVVSRWDQGGFTLGVNLGKDNAVTFFQRAEPDPSGTGTDPPVLLYNAVCGNRMLLRGGKTLTVPGGARHPRTAIGVTQNKHLILLVADGRQDDRSVGMTPHELAQTLERFGAVAALNLDGGGSATLVIADPEARIVNVPLPLGLPAGMTKSPPGIERSVGNNIGLFAAPLPARPAAPATAKE